MSFSHEQPSPELHSHILLDAFAVVEPKKRIHGRREQVKSERLGANLRVHMPRPCSSLSNGNRSRFLFA